MCLTAALVPSCGEELPPQAAPSTQTQAAAATWSPTQAAVLTYVGPRGELLDVQRVEDIPEDRRGFVGVHRLDGERAPAGSVWVANLAEPSSADTYELRAVQVGEFELLMLGSGASSKVELPEGLTLPEVKPQTEAIIVYKTEWCGVCKKLRQWLDSKNVEYVLKDIEKDPEAAAELRAKSQAAGVAMGSVPVIDVRGELFVGFDRKALEKRI